MGSPRSGTTWLSEILNVRNDFRYLFEPFRPGKVRALAHLGVRPYVRIGDRRERVLGPVREILSGRVRDPWVDQYNRRSFATRRLVKDPWTTLMAGWLADAFPRVPVVFLVRHPCAVAHSQMQMGAWKWHVNPDQLLSQPDLWKDHLEGVSGPVREALREAESTFDRHVLTWCVENLVGLSGLTASRGRTTVVFYEDLCLDPQSTLSTLFGFLGLPIDRREFDAARRPSALTRRDSAIVTGEELVAGWRAHVSRDDAARAAAIVARFGLDDLYSEDPLPARVAAITPPA
jgi:hypothetical protein